MIGTICTLVLFAALLVWMFLFEVRLAHLLDLAEQLVDRDHGPALDDEPVVPLLSGGRIDDAGFAYDLARMEDRFLDWRATLAEKGGRHL